MRTLAALLLATSVARASDLPRQCDRPELTDLLFYECLLTVAEAERDLARADVTYLRAVLDASTDHALAVEAEPRGWPTWALGVAVALGLVGGLLVAR